MNVDLKADTLDQAISQARHARADLLCITEAPNNVRGKKLSDYFTQLIETKVLSSFGSLGEFNGNSSSPQKHNSVVSFYGSSWKVWRLLKNEFIYHDNLKNGRVSSMDGCTPTVVTNGNTSVGIVCWHGPKNNYSTVQKQDVFSQLTETAQFFSQKMQCPFILTGDFNIEMGKVINNTPLENFWRIDYSVALGTEAYEFNSSLRYLPNLNEETRHPVVLTELWNKQTRNRD